MTIIRISVDEWFEWYGWYWRLINILLLSSQLDSHDHSNTKYRVYVHANQKKRTNREKSTTFRVLISSINRIKAFPSLLQTTKLFTLQRQIPNYIRIMTKHLKGTMISRRCTWRNISIPESVDSAVCMLYDKCDERVKRNKQFHIKRNIVLKGFKYK